MAVTRQLGIMCLNVLARQGCVRGGDGGCRGVGWGITVEMKAKHI